MRWIQNKKRYKLGDKQIEKIFCFYPITLNNETRFLETAYIVNFVFETYKLGTSDKIRYRWGTERWATKEEYYNQQKGIKIKKRK